MGRPNPRRGAGIGIPHQNVVLGDGDVVGMHGEADALLHLRGESPRLAGALAPLLPRAAGKTGTDRDRVSTEPGWQGGDSSGMREQ